MKRRPTIDRDASTPPSSRSSLADSSWPAPPTGQRASLLTTSSSRPPLPRSNAPAERPSTKPERRERPSRASEVANSNGLRPSLKASVAPPSQDPWKEYAARIADAPESGTVRGLYFAEILRLAPMLRSMHQQRYVAFSKYPLRDFMQLLIDAGRTVHASKTPEQALYTLGLTTYSTFASSISGMALLSSIGIDIERVLDLVSRAYPLALEPSRVELVSRGIGEAVVQLRDVWTFPESYHVGVWLGGMDILGLTGEVDVIRHNWSSVDFHLKWRRKTRDHGG